MLTVNSSVAFSPLVNALATARTEKVALPKMALLLFCWCPPLFFLNCANNKFALSRLRPSVRSPLHLLRLRLLLLLLPPFLRFFEVILKHFFPMTHHYPPPPFFFALPQSNSSLPSAQSYFQLHFAVIAMHFLPSLHKNWLIPHFKNENVFLINSLALTFEEGPIGNGLIVPAVF